MTAFKKGCLLFSGGGVRETILESFCPLLDPPCSTFMYFLDLKLTSTEPLLPQKWSGAEGHVTTPRRRAT
jgi:hypothetical protein